MNLVRVSKDILSRKKRLNNMVDLLDKRGYEQQGWYQGYGYVFSKNMTNGKPCYAGIVIDNDENTVILKYYRTNECIQLHIRENFYL